MSKEERLTVVKVTNFRAFQGEAEFHIAPLTLLIGENSSGKTSAMAAISQALGNRHWRAESFAVEPYCLQSYKHLAFGSNTSCELSVTRSLTGGNLTSRAVLSRQSNATKLTAFSIQVGGALSVDGQLKRDYFGVNLEWPDPDRDTATVKDRGEIPRDSFLSAISGKPMDHYQFAFVLSFLLSTSKRKEYSNDKAERLRRPLTRWSTNLTRQVVSVAPIRTAPSRIYQGSEQSRNAEGGHVPYVIREFQRSKSVRAELFKKGIREFGEGSGMFTGVTARDMNSTGGEAFEMLVEKNGVKRTVADVGYGVSQVLPVLAECLSAGDGAVLCIQQPEVHLHPIAQAELTSFFVKLIEQRGNSFVIETHSDYLVDRARLEVREGRIRPEDVSILYFSNDGELSRVRRIELDVQGELVDPPEAYRQFFMREQMRLMGFDE